jgi:hypothetical protein
MATLPRGDRLQPQLASSACDCIFKYKDSVIETHLVSVNLPTNARVDPYVLSPKCMVLNRESRSPPIQMVLVRCELLINAADAELLGGAW